MLHAGNHALVWCQFDMLKLGSLVVEGTVEGDHSGHVASRPGLKIQCRPQSSGEQLWWLTPFRAWGLGGTMVCVGEVCLKSLCCAIESV